MWVPSAASLAPRTDSTTFYDKSTTIQNVTWVLTGVFVVMFFAREFIKYVVLRRLGGDDLLILFATICAVGLSATTLLLASEGLGVLQRLTVSNAATLMKGFYASDFLYIATLCFTKLSLVVYFHNIIVQRPLRRAVLGLGIFTLVWGVASLAAVAFQCELPSPWRIMTLNCYNKGFFWIVFCIIDMTTDVSIIMLSVNLVAYLHVKLSEKVVVVACFAPRILVIGAALARLIYLYPITPHSNPQYNLWVPTICAQVQVCLSISTACIPYVKPFFGKVGSGSWRTSELRRNGLANKNIYIFGSGSAYTPFSKGGKELHSFDSTAAVSFKRGRLDDISPRIPTPVPLSPLTPPHFNTPASSNTSSRSPSQRGLKLQIPKAVAQTTATVTTPQTASSIALSPYHLSPYTPTALLPTHQEFSSRDPTPPPRAYTPLSVVASSTYSSEHDVSPLPCPRSPSRQPGLSLFPSPASGRYNTTPRMRAQPLTPSATKRAPSVTSRLPGPQIQYPPRTSSAAQNSAATRRTAKFAVAPNPCVASPSVTIPSRVSRPHTQNGGTGPSLPSYYLTTPPPGSPSTLPFPKAPSPIRERNLTVISPRNSSHKDQISPVSPPTPLTFWRDDTSPESARTGTLMLANRPWEIEEMPLVRDVRSSPRIVVQHHP